MGTQDLNGPFHGIEPLVEVRESYVCPTCLGQLDIMGNCSPCGYNAYTYRSETDVRIPIKRSLSVTHQSILEIETQKITYEIMIHLLGIPYTDIAFEISGGWHNLIEGLRIQHGLQTMEQAFELSLEILHWMIEQRDNGRQIAAAERVGDEFVGVEQMVIPLKGESDDAG